MCEVIEENLKTCAVPTFNLFETCVPKEAKGLPTYMLKTTRAIVKYICNTDGAHLLGKILCTSLWYGVVCNSDNATIN